MIKLPSSVTYIGENAFGAGRRTGSEIRTIVLPKNIKEIKISKGAFSGLKKSVVIRVPKSKKMKYKKLLKASGINKKVKIK